MNWNTTPLEMLEMEIDHELAMHLLTDLWLLEMPIGTDRQLGTGDTDVES